MINSNPYPILVSNVGLEEMSGIRGSVPSNGCRLFEAP